MASATIEAKCMLERGGACVYREGERGLTRRSGGEVTKRGGEQGRRAEVDRPTRQCADCSEREGKRETAGLTGKREKGRDLSAFQRLQPLRQFTRAKARARAWNALRRARVLVFLALDPRLLSSDLL